jgi:two-component system CheB/CheR fusion protein
LTHNKPVGPPDTSLVEFERLLSYLHVSRGFDFSSYKRSTLQRRIEKRMSQVEVESYVDYLDYLEVHQDEFQNLFNTILINVTSFFRDPEAWEFLASDVVPRVVEAKGADETIRIWVAGCASGEEAYTVAMVLASALGTPGFRERVKIYATDLDSEALNSSRIASYCEKDIASVPPDMLSRFFERANDRLVFDRELRRSVIFGRHDLVQDAPISRVDLLLCRNTLMYFNAEAQDRILARFHFALNNGGYLFLGKAETLLTHTSLFSPVDLKNRVFTKIGRGRIAERPSLLVNGAYRDGRTDMTEIGRLRDAAFDNAPVAQMVLDPVGRLTFCNSRARSLFGLSAKDLGRPIQDLEVSYRPIELRSGIEQALRQRRPVMHKNVPWAAIGGEPLYLDIVIAPVNGESSEISGISVTFEDVSTSKRLQAELLNFNQELETLYEEVQSTNEELQTTNEELQSTVEELETTNEELQSTNEELETMNEELQSANEELETINGELRVRSHDLNRANSLLESILGGLRDGVVVLDQELLVLAWNHQSEDLWGLRADEVAGKHFLNLDFGLPVVQLRAPARTCLANGENQELIIHAINRRGKSFDCHIVLTPLQGFSDERMGVIILMSSQPEA